MGLSGRILGVQTIAHAKVGCEMQPLVAYHDNCSVWDEGYASRKANLKPQCETLNPKH